MLVIETFPVYPLGCNCTVLVDDQSREAIVIDPGGDEDKIHAVLKKHQATLKFILHTHAHFDHFLGTNALSAMFHQPEVCLHQDDHFLYTNLAMQCKAFGIPVSGKDTEIAQVSRFLQDNEELRLGTEHTIEVMHTPGHSPGSVSYKMDTSERQIIFSGDTLFQESIGRTDLWGGDSDLIIKSIKNRILDKHDAEVVPGHGAFTTVFHEKKYNPFLK